MSKDLSRFHPIIFLFIIAPLILSLTLAPRESMAAASRAELKIIKQSTKTLKRSRKSRERVKAVNKLGRIKKAEVVPLLIKALSDSDGNVRRAAADSLWRLGDLSEPAREPLMKLLDDPVPGVRVRAASALGMLGVSKNRLVTARVAGLEARRLRDRILAVRGLVGFVPNADLVAPVLEVAAAEAKVRFESELGKRYLNPIDIVKRMNKTKDRDHVEPIIADIENGNPGSRFLIEGLSELKPLPENWTGLLVGRLGTGNQADLTQALVLLGQRTTEAQGVKIWIKPVTGVLKNRDRHIRSLTLQTLGRAGGFAAEAAPLLLPLTTDRDARIRKTALGAIAGIGDRTQPFPARTLDKVAKVALTVVRKAAVADPKPGVRRAAVKALGILRLSSDNVLTTFVAVARKDIDPQVRFAALLAIRDLGKNGVSARADIEWIRDNDTDKGNRGAAKNALHAVLNNEPRYSMNVAAKAIKPGAKAALDEIRKTSGKFTAHEFYLAITSLNAQAVKRYLDAGMSADMRLDRYGSKPLHALFFGPPGCAVTIRPTPAATLAVARLLLDRGADPNGEDDRGNTPLKMAASSCDGRVIKLLLSAGADLNHKDPSGMTVFEMTLWSGSDAGDALLDAGFRLPAKKVKQLRESYKDNPKALKLLNRAAR